MSLDFSFSVSFFRDEYVELLFFFFARSAMTVFATLIVFPLSASSITDVTSKIEVGFFYEYEYLLTLMPLKCKRFLHKLSSNEKRKPTQEVSVASLEI